jgi:hypothetical protein
MADLRAKGATDPDKLDEGDRLLVEGARLLDESQAAFEQRAAAYSGLDDLLEEALADLASIAEAVDSRSQ